MPLFELPRRVRSRIARLVAPTPPEPGSGQDASLRIIAANQAALTALMLQAAAKTQQANPHLVRLGFGSGAPRIAHAASPWYAYWAKELDRPPLPQRDLWTLAATLQILFEAEKLHAGARVGVLGERHPLEGYLSDLGLIVRTHEQAETLEDRAYDVLLSERLVRPDWSGWLADCYGRQKTLRQDGVAVHIAPVRLRTEATLLEPGLSSEDVETLARAAAAAVEHGDLILPIGGDEQAHPLDCYVSIIAVVDEVRRSWPMDFKVLRESVIETPFLLAIQRHVSTVPASESDPDDPARRPTGFS